MAALTTFGIGGPADYYGEIHSREELQAVCGEAKKTDIAVTALGFGSNVLISDQGVRGMVIRLDGNFKDFSINREGAVVAGAAARLPKLVTVLAEKGYQGMEALVGVPGTVGGGIFMNAGTREGEIKDHLLSAAVFSLKDGRFCDWAAKDIGFGYRHSSFQKSQDIIVAATFKFPLAENKKDVSNRIKSLMERRKITQPVDTKNVGSIFQNPPGDYAARLIEAAGLKGTRMGGAVVSDRHANFIVNLEQAKASDVRALIEIVRRTVREKFGVDLNTEVRMLGEFR